MPKKSKTSRYAKPGRMNIISADDVRDSWENLTKSIAEDERKSAEKRTKKNSRRSKPRKRNAKRTNTDVNSAVERLKFQSVPKKPKARPAKKGMTPEDIFGTTLRACDTVSKVRTWLQKTHTKLADKAAQAVARRKLSDPSRAVLGGLFQVQATSVCTMTNPRLASDAFEHLVKALLEIDQSDSAMKFAFITTIGGDCATSTDKPVIDLHRSQERAKRTFRAMSKHFIAVTELSMFNNVGHPDGGMLIQPHEHAIVFGADLSKITKVAAKHAGDYPPNVTGAKPIEVTPVADLGEVNLARLAAYLLKAPGTAINHKPATEDKKAFLNKSEKSDRYIRFLRMAQLRSMLSFEDCTFAGGDGLKMRKGLVDILRALCASDAPPNQRLLHPDGIAAFWVELAKELGREKWALPVIKRRP